jgi:hypothetical protein
MGRDSLCVDHGFIRRPIQMQVPLMDTSEGPEIRPEHCARPFTPMAVDRTSTLTLILPGPFAGTVAHGGVGGVAAMIALPRVKREPRAVGWNVVGHQRVAGPRVRVITHPDPRLTRLPRDHPAEGGRALASVPGPWRLWPRRRGGSAGSRWGGLVFPRVLVQRIRLEGGASHPRCRGVACSWAWRRGRRVGSGCRARPNSRAKRAVGAPLASPRRSNPSVAGRCRVFAKTVPVSRVY